VADLLHGGRVRVVVLRDYDVNKVRGVFLPSYFPCLLVDSLLFWPEMFIALLCLMGGGID